MLPNLWHINISGGNESPLTGSVYRLVMSGECQRATRQQPFRVYEQVKSKSGHFPRSMISAPAEKSDDELGYACFQQKRSGTLTI